MVFAPQSGHGGVLGGASRGLRTAIHPEYNPKIVLSNSDYKGLANRLQR